MFSMRSSHFIRGQTWRSLFNLSSLDDQGVGEALTRRVGWYTKLVSKHSLQSPIPDLCLCIRRANENKDDSLVPQAMPLPPRRYRLGHRHSSHPCSMPTSVSTGSSPELPARQKLPWAFFVRLIRNLQWDRCSRQQVLKITFSIWFFLPIHSTKL